MSYNVQLEIDTGNGVMAPVSDMRVFAEHGGDYVRELNGWPAPEAAESCIAVVVCAGQLDADLRGSLRALAYDCRDNPGAVVSVIEVPE